jgi:hypothetical protein
MTATPLPSPPAEGFSYFGLRGFERKTSQLATGSLATDASETGAIDLAPGYRLYSVEFNRPARLRTYASVIQRIADASRPVGTDPDTTTDHGLWFEFVATDTLLSAVLSPMVDAFCPTGISVPWAVTNLDVSTGVVTVDLTWVRTE